jgi:hypothetical protein
MPSSAVRPLLGVTGGEPPEGDADTCREDHGRNGQLDGRREADEELVEYGLAVDDADAKIAVDDVVQVVQVLLPERIVESEVLTHRRDPLGSGVLPEDGRRRITGQQVDEGE